MVRVGGRAAWPVCVVSLSLVAVGTVLALGNGTDARALGHLPFVAVCAVVAAVIETGRPGNAVGRLLALGGFSFALMEACGDTRYTGRAPRSGPFWRGRRPGCGCRPTRRSR